MREREAAATVAAGLCISVAVLRMAAQSLPFDWMTLVLVLMAAASVLLPSLMGGRRPERAARPVPTESAPQAGGSPAEDAASPESDEEMPDGDTTVADSAMGALETLNEQMDKEGWAAGSGGLFDALRALREDKPFAAMCAARGTLLMLARRLPAYRAPNETFTALCDALDTAAQAGERAVPPDEAGRLFDCALRALGWLEAQGS